MRTLRLLAVLIVAAGCASARGLEVGYPAAGVNRALLASAAPRRVALGPVTDRRQETRLGVDPQTRKDIVTRRPVTEIVGEALTLELGANGLTVAADRPDVVLAADVEEFRLDVIAGRGGGQYVGKVALALHVSYGPTGQRLFDRRYVGVTRRQTEVDPMLAAREAMDTALARAMRDLATDPELARAITGTISALAR